MKAKRGITLFLLLIISGLGLSSKSEEPHQVSALYESAHHHLAVSDLGFQHFLKQYDSALSAALAEEGVPGAACAIVKDGTLALLKTYGVKEVGTKDKISPRTLFRAASLSKGMTGLLSSKLVEQGLLDWESPMADYLPDSLMAKLAPFGDWQLQQLLSHTTGLPRHTYSNLLNMGRPYMAILGLLPQVQLAHLPGELHNYQNVAFNLSADMLASAAQQPFAELMANQLFRPLGMDQASVGWTDMMAAPDKAMPHHRTEQGYAPKAIEPNYYEVPAAAGVNVSISDMAHLLKALLGHQADGLSDNARAQAFRPHIAMSTASRVLRNWGDLKAAHYGMGWRVLEGEGFTIIGHSGYVNGYRAELAFCTETGIGIALLSNAPNQTVGATVPAFFEQYATYLQNHHQ